MSVADRRGAEGGFTLLETLVALTVLGLLMIALVQGVRTGLDFWHAQTRRTAATAGLDSATRVLRTILTTIPAEPAAIDAPMSIGFQGQSDKLVLVGRLPTGLGNARRVDMMIYLRAGRVVISWTPHRRDLVEATPPPVPTVTELISGVRRLEFAYWGSLTPNAPAAWLERWAGPALPELVRVRIGFAAGDNRRWPDLIVAPQL